ncbi:MAG: Ig-like domain-containing protein, partial [Patescibacteria group bacterium]|nr:Ig-like domain-containing protein [Patescibacteria group bacterium]
MLNDKRNRKFSRTAILVVSVLAVFLFASATLAQVDVGLEEVGETTGLSGQDIRITIAKIIRNAFALLGIIAVGIFVFAGYTYMTAGGDAGKVETAKAWMKNAVIGILIMLSAFGITQFIINQLEGAFYGRGGRGIVDGIPFDPLSGSLGRGIVQTHYPARNETDVPRNTMISITFKEAVLVEDIIEGDLINVENIRISTSAERDDGPYLENVYARVTEDHRTFVFDPQDLLGSSGENTWYTVMLESDIDLADGTPAFGGAFADGYMWEFEVSTVLDLTPPRIESVVPRSGTHPRNIVIQINFDEPVDPTSAQGSGNLVVSSAGVLAGEFSVGNGYRSVEFQTDDLCGMNSCGGEVYCLPANSDIAVLVRAASLGIDPPASFGFPYDGIVDMVGNSFDGNNDGTASGPPDDNFEWTFQTSNTIDLTPPTIESITPDVDEGSVELDAPINITFSKVMSVTTLDTRNVSLLTSPMYELWYDTRSTNLDDFGEPAGREDNPTKTRLEIKHGVFAPSIPETRFDYFPGVSSGAKDVMQNCYFPGSGGICEASPDIPYCCNGRPSADRCEYLP